MKKSLIIAMIMVIGIFSACDLSNNSGFTEEPGGGSSIPLAEVDYVFDLGAVPVITISISTNEWNTLLTNFDVFKKNEKFVHADFQFDKNGTVINLTNVAFRIRGNSSRRRPEGDNLQNGITPSKWILHGEGTTYYHSAHFRLGFNEFEKGQNLYGLRNLNLKWFKDDPNYVREIFGYDLYRRFGVTTAPHSSYARIYVEFKETGESVYFGPYEMIESLDKSYLKTTFTNSWNGYLWKCQWGANYLNSSTADSNISMEVEWEGGKYTPYYDLKRNKSEFTNLAKPQLVNFIQTLNSHVNGSSALKAWLNASLDVDQFIRFMAVSTMLGNWDSYVSGGNNHYIYFDESGRAHFIPYDLDNILGTHYDAGDNPSSLSVDMWKNSAIPLSDKVLSIDTFYSDYTNYIYQLSVKNNEYFDITASTNRILVWRALIDPAYFSGVGVAPDLQNNNNAISDNAGGDWAKYPNFRLFNGDSSGDGVNLPGANFIKSRQVSAATELGFPVPVWGGGGGYLKNTGQVYIRGAWNGWADGTAMTLVSDYTWEVTIPAFSASLYKFTAQLNAWSPTNWGDTDANGVAGLGEDDLTTGLTGSVTFTFNDNTLAYTNYN